MQVKKYLFDLGNVFFDWNPRHVLKEIITDEELLNKFHNKVIMPKPPGIKDMLKEIVYAGNEPFNVPKKYYEIIKDENLRYGHNHIKDE